MPRMIQMHCAVLLCRYSYAVCMWLPAKRASPALCHLGIAFCHPSQLVWFLYHLVLLAVEYRMFLRSRNTLISRRTNSGPARQESNASLKGSVKSFRAAAANGVAVQQQQQDLATAGSSPGGWAFTPASRPRLDPHCSTGQCLTPTAALANHGCGTDGDRLVYIPQQSCGKDAGSQHLHEVEFDNQEVAVTLDEQPSGTLSASRAKNILLWGRAWAKASAVVRFKQAAEMAQTNCDPHDPPA